MPLLDDGIDDAVGGCARRLRADLRNGKTQQACSQVEEFMTNLSCDTGAVPTDLAVAKHCHDVEENPTASIPRENQDHGELPIKID